jgi:hypothetical protein
MIRDRDVVQAAVDKLANQENIGDFFIGEGIELAYVPATGMRVTSCPFARWLKKETGATMAVSSGVDCYIDDMNGWIQLPDNIIEWIARFDREFARR